jgi:kynurenine formamidase
MIAFDWKLAKRIGVVIAAACIAVSWPADAQTRQSGPWWPNAEWGPEDQAGASNRITAEKVLSALRMATTGKMYEIGQVYEQNMPFFGTRSFSLAQVKLSGGGTFGSNRLVANEEFVAAQLGQVGTQLDGLGHVGQEVTMQGGATEQVFYNGFTAKEMDAPNGLQKLGIEHIKPIVTRGILIDVAGYKGVPRLPNSYEVTVQDVLGALARQGMSAADIAPGDAVLFSYGWSSLWSDPAAYSTNPPGIGVAVARWVAERRVTMIGSDTFGSEVQPSAPADQSFPVHQELMMRNGILNLENLRFDELLTDRAYQFLLIVTPLRLKGASGSPVRPIAIR